MIKNTIQYISFTHTSKEMAKENKKKCNGLHSVYLKDMTFEEICNLMENGNTIGRVGTKTSFVMIDVDCTSINISKVFDTYKDDKDVFVCYSASNNPLKYHILVNLNKIIDINEYKECLENEFNKIREKLCYERFDYMVLDENASNFYQCFFGQSIEHEYENILEDSKKLYCWTKKDNDPKFMIEKEYHPRPSLNSADYCKKNGLLTVKEEKRFDVILPSMTNGKLKLIAEGHRYNWCRMTGTKILMRIFHLNHQFNEGWTKWDFLETTEWAFRTNIVKPNTMEEELKSLILWLDNKWDILVNKSYDEQCAILEPYFNSSKKQYKSRTYNLTVMTDLVQEHIFDDTHILFTDKDELKDICKDLMIDYYKFIKYAKSIKYDVVFECETRKRKYDCSGMNKEEFETYCKENNINRMTKSRLKKQYNIQ